MDQFHHDICSLTACLQASPSGKGTSVTVIPITKKVFILRGRKQAVADRYKGVPVRPAKGEHPEPGTVFHGAVVEDPCKQSHLFRAGAVKQAVINNEDILANAIKALGKGNQKAVRSSIAYKALVRIGAIYDLEGALKDLTPEERFKERQASIKPLVEEFFAWIRETLADQKVLPKGETAKGLNYCLNQEKYLKVFLTDGEVPIDDSASERALRNFTIGRKNWVCSGQAFL